MVQQQQQQQQLNLYKGTVPPYNQVRLRIHVGEKGRLGCGVCRGIVPGLTVQVHLTIRHDHYDYDLLDLKI